MAQENVKAIRDAFRIFNKSGVAAATEAFEDLLDPNFQLGEERKSREPARLCDEVRGARSCAFPGIAALDDK